MDIMVANQIEALSYRPIRRFLVELLHKNPLEDTPRDELTAEGTNVELLLDFQQFYLPKLEDQGFIEHDQEKNVVTKGPKFAEIKPLLKLIDNHKDELPDDWL